MKKCFKIVLLGIFLTLVFNLSNKTFSEYVSSLSTTETGVKDNIVTINDLEADYYYYIGKNYTDSDGTLPTLENKNIYSENNLVETKITYYGYDIENKNHGYVSLEENQDTYIYYKMYPVNNNNTNSKTDDYIEIELIDNPFTNRPNNKGFNGWLTDNKNISISFDNSYYRRMAKIPVTYVDNKPQVIDIRFYSIWKDAKVAYINSNNNWASAFGILDKSEMQPIGGEIPVYESVVGLYTQESVSFWSNYPDGAVNERGQSLSGRCNSWFSSCTYYMELEEGSNYNPSVTYYKLSGNGNNASMNEYKVQIAGYEQLPKLEKDTILAGFYRLKTMSNGSSLNGLYSVNGILQKNATCNTSSGCNYYELVSYYDKDGNIEKADGETIYYYFPTRDTNIIVMNESLNTKWSDTENKPFTLTSVYNGNNYTNSVTWNISNQYITCYNDTVIENIKINSQSSNSSSDPSSNSTTTRNLYANYNNVKIGRGIIQNGSYKTFNHVFGGNNNTSSLGNSSNITKYRLTVESGFYNTITLANGPSNNNNNKYIEGQGIYGNDYDRAKQNNSNLDVYFETAGSWGAGNYYASTNTGITFDTTIKSGQFGTGKNDHTTGVYVGGRSYGSFNSSRQIKVEGGWIYNLIGGPLTANNRGDINDIYIYMTGGSIDMIIGGAGTSTTYGNRIIQVTGGTVNYSVFGGSNSYEGGSDDGKLTGSSYVYIGGNATIGNSNYVSNNTTLWGAESGSVFGIGNGNTSSSTIGTNENSNIIIADECTILGNVYGGGNYSATGIDSRKNTTQTNIKVIGGTVNGNIYGGGNRNGSGSNSKSSSININVLSGNIKGSIFGGSKSEGTIYGNVNIKAYGGNINNIYGGGEGNSTKVSQNIDIVFGDKNYNNLLLNNLYGGSAYGTVNGTSTNKTDYSTNITINNGEIKDSVFGGAQGSENYNPYVLGDVTVTLNSGKVNNLYGGNDLSSTPLGTVKIYLNGGNVTNVYGGGNKTELTTSNIYLQGTNAENIYGGSNITGNVTTSNIFVTNGSANNIYGGNNVGGNTNTSNITVDGGNINNIYGGGKETSTNTSNVIINDGNSGNIYGGGENAAVTTTNVTINGGTIQTIYGGSNTTGDVTTSNVIINDGTITDLYGGNNVGGKTITSIVKIEGATLTTIYGGGNNATTENSNVIVNNGTIIDLYGGGNNENGTTPITNLRLNGGTITNAYGGGNKATTITSNINANGSTIANLYGGANQAGITDANIELTSGNITNVYGGSNKSGNVSNANILNDSYSTSPIEVDLSYKLTDVDPNWQDANYKTVAEITVTIKNTSDTTLEQYSGYIKLNDSTLYSNYSSTEVVENNGTYTFNEKNIHYGTNKIEANGTYQFTFSIYSKLNKENFEIKDYKVTTTDSNNKTPSEVKKLEVKNLYGGNNAGGITNNSNINLTFGTYGNIYGGGNFAVLNNPSITVNNIIADNIYGGGNQALISKNTTINVKNTTINQNIYGGGNAGIVSGNTNVYVNDSNVKGSIYGGGNGATAVVNGKTNVLVDGTTNVLKHVFGGGNAANTGLEHQTTSTEVNIAGGTINGNIYGGGNTSVVYGTTIVNIGIDNITKQADKNNILIKGTVFGGGEANEAGSENYDFSFISVTLGTTVNINGNNHDSFNINGSIFGSGNASSTEGYSYINISNYGNDKNYKRNISIQRANLVTIDNSAIELVGATDRTNEYSTVLFSLSRIKHLKLKNNSTLYLESGANLLEELTSSYDDENEEKLSAVTINGNQITKTVENKIYMLEGKNLNIATNENATAYGKVNGMTFFGMYIKDRNDLASPGLYNTNYNDGDIVDNNDVYQFTVGSYILGLHASNHDTTKDGFYTNYAEDGIINIDYIKPTPDDSTYYMWSIGEQVVTIEISLTASKYLTLGTEELAMLNYSDPNTIFSIVGFNYNDLDANINLVKESEVPRVAETTEQADNVMSLVMRSTNNGWITDGETTFLTSDDSIEGTTLYKSENSTQVPSFQFYIYHSKNLGSSDEMGSVTISFVVITPTDEINNKVERVNLIVNLNRALYTTNDYEAAMTIGKEYDLFASTNVNLTTTGSLSAYYSLFTEGDSIYKDGYHRTLVSTYAFPENTKITIINLNEKSTNEYYYYIVTEENRKAALEEYDLYGECSYKFSDFVRMGSTSLNNNYSDSINNTLYYDEKSKTGLEEFIVIVDFSDAVINENIIDKSLLIELRNKDDQTVVNVLGIEQERMQYSLYTNSNAVVDVKGAMSSKKIYPGDSIKLNVTTNFNRKRIDSEVIYDTDYFDQKLGIKIWFKDKNGNQVTGASLLGLTYEYDGKIYYPTMDGSVRISLAEQMANVSANIIINTTDSVAAGDYTMIIESFGSSDGIYYGLKSSDTDEIEVTVLDTVYGLNLSMGDYIVMVDKTTGNNLNENSDLRFNLKYSSSLANPNIRLSLYRRNYDSIYSSEYELVDLQDYLKQDLIKTNKTNEYLLTDTPLSDISYNYNFKENLKTGTYKFVVSLYDNNTYIGDVYKYIIIKEAYSE